MGRAGKLTTLFNPPLFPMRALSFVQVLIVALPLALLGCGEPTTDDLRKEFAGMSDEKLQTEVMRWRSECRQAKSESDKPGAPCSRFSLAEEVAESKGWCWGPQAAANSDKSWLRCAEDVTRTVQASGIWYASTKSGACRETLLQEAIGKVLEHDGPWNIKMTLSKDGGFDVSSRLKDGSRYSVQLYSNCGAALMVHIAQPGDADAMSIAAPLGMSPRDAGEYFGFDVRNCNGYSFGSGLGCLIGYQAGMPAPIQLSDGSTPCSNEKPVQFDFQPGRGMVGVTCSLTADKREFFGQRMSRAFGAAEKTSGGSLRWKLGTYTITSVEYVVQGRTFRKVSVFQE